MDSLLFTGTGKERDEADTSPPSRPVGLLLRFELADQLIHLIRNFSEFLC